MHESSIIQYFTEQATEKGIQQGIEQGYQQGLQQGYQQGLQQGRQEGRQQGRQEGARESTVEAIVEALEIRFQLQPKVARLLEPYLETIDDLQHLKRLRRKAMRAPTLEEFMVWAGDET